MKSSISLTVMLFFLLSSVNFSAEKDYEVIKIWPNGTPEETTKIYTADQIAKAKAKTTEERIAFVDTPTLTIIPPDKDKANGCAMVICPGGGYNILAWPKEGIEIGEYFSSLGVTAFVLKYRVPRRPNLEPHVAPLEDSQRAIRVVRQNAKKWNIDEKRVGILGFSAGGNLTVMTGLHYEKSTYPKQDEADEISCRPDFMCPIYCAYIGVSEKGGPLKSDDVLPVNKKTPPAFFAVTSDDVFRGPHSALLFVKLREAGVPAELHVFSKGGHGYGIRPSDHPVSKWHHLCGAWLKSEGFLK